MLSKIIKENEFLICDSDFIKLERNEFYKVSCEIVEGKGTPYSGFFHVTIFDENKTRKRKYIRWMNSFQGRQSFEIIFFNKITDVQINLGYWINQGVPIKSDVEVELQEPDQIKITKLVNYKGKEEFDNPKKFNISKNRELTAQDENLLEKNITWIISSGRTGSSWFADQLLRHPEIVYWPEPYIGRHLGLVEQYFDPNTGIPKFVRIFDEQNNENAPTYFFSKNYKEYWMPYLRKMILIRAFGQAQSLSKNIIIKEPTATTCGDIIFECLPSSKFIFLIRDGRDVVDSRIAMHGLDTWAKLRPLNERSRKDVITNYCASWRDEMEMNYTTYLNCNPDTRILVKYENLRNDTVNELKRIYKFLQIKVTDSFLNKIYIKTKFENLPQEKKGPKKFNRSAKIGGWKMNFSDSEQKKMNSILHETLQKFDYS